MKKKNPSADRYVHSLKPEDAIIMEVMRDFVLEYKEGIQEVFKYHCPFYMYNGPLCYLSFEKKTNTVVIGFIQGFKFEDRYNLLSTDTKQVRKLYFKNTDDLDENILNYYLSQALVINEARGKKK
jgi:hypothetical protein